MSDDLISRKALMEGRVENDPVRIAAMCAKTAFEKEKVINELMIKAAISEEKMEFYAERGFTQNESFADGKARAYRAAIEIVAKGGAE